MCGAGYSVPAMRQRPVGNVPAAPTPAVAPRIVDDLPEGTPVSLVVCVLNEERHVAEALRRALDQDYAGDLEVIVALGPSRDRTDVIVAQLGEADPRVRTVRNPSPLGATPSGLNAAIAAARYPVIARIDGHSLLPRDYLRAAVDTLRRTGADNVGGVMAAEGSTDFERAVALAMTTRLGVGNAAFHTGGGEGQSDTVYLGVFRRSALDRVGGYDEAFLRAQDWELNLRIRRSGGVVWFLPSLQVSYRPRSTVQALSRQYFHYGRWRRVVARRHPETLNVRYLAPPLALVGVSCGTLLAALGWWPAAVLPCGYALLVLAGSAVGSRRLPWPVRVRVPLAVAVMHFSWGAGFLTSPRRLVGH